MRNLPLIASALYLEPWGLRGSVYWDLCTQFEALTASGKLEERMEAGDGVGPMWRNARTGQEGYFHPQVETSDDGGVAYLEINGILGKRLSLLEMQCGSFDIALLEEQMANVRDDPKVHTLVLNFETPGGRVQGLEQAGESILEVSAAGKQVIGYTEMQCCSAGYFLASACDQFFAHPDAVVGSISTICAAIDRSGEFEQRGWVLELFTTGKYKGVGVPGKAWTEEDRQFVRERGAVLDAVFKDFVGKHRGLSAALMEGAHWYSRAAPKGLIDGHAKSIRQVLEAALLRG